MSSQVVKFETEIKSLSTDDKFAVVGLKDGTMACIDMGVYMLFMFFEVFILL